MRSYVFSTGLFSAVTSGLTLLRALREGETFTWRQALAWASWAISVALVIGTIVDVRRAEKGETLPADSPVHGKEAKLAYKNLNR
ncbi:hypothetical protein [Microbacterium sp. C7(2022)]|uniref:hypothetical protein n=1 Tax=Microbacterium sp. C7(2022) TaxID=2992759 RepID=UPI00237B6D79|nr:hypothetical protein [Microbacterium sp. C7(2022)]MDE0545633.1 hypothetical protein [Microbacterium sp. C7(2022)]